MLKGIKVQERDNVDLGLCHHHIARSKILEFLCHDHFAEKILEQFRENLRKLKITHVWVEENSLVIERNRPSKVYKCIAGLYKYIHKLANYRTPHIHVQELPLVLVLLGSIP